MPAPSAAPHRPLTLPATVTSVRVEKHTQRRQLLPVSASSSRPSPMTHSDVGELRRLWPSAPSRWPARPAHPASVLTTSEPPSLPLMHRSVCEPASATYSGPVTPAGATTLTGASKRERVTASSRWPRRPGLPASVRTPRARPSCSAIARTQWLPVSATSTVPSGQTLTPLGPSKRALAAPPSRWPLAPLPAHVETDQASSGSTRLSLLCPLSQTITEPSRSTARPLGLSQPALAQMVVTDTPPPGWRTRRRRRLLPVSLTSREPSRSCSVAPGEANVARSAAPSPLPIRPLPAMVVISKASPEVSWANETPCAMSSSATASDPARRGMRDALLLFFIRGANRFVGWLELHVCAHAATCAVFTPRADMHYDVQALQ